MTRLTVNGMPVETAVAPRTHLADFLRDDLGLTGTHLGCEHGVCGACTVLIDGAPARACIAFARALDGADIRTIEGLEDDPLTVALRAAFTAEHALQCGYCTPGMLVTARDIVRRLPGADAARVRLELAGNLCRCTGYAGIVRAILRVLREGAPADPPPPPKPVAAPVPAPLVPQSGTPAVVPDGAHVLQQSVRIAAPLARVWAAVRDPALIAACIPGAQDITVDGAWISGTFVASLGPITARFAGRAHVTYTEGHNGTIEGGGRDRASHLAARVDFILHEFDADATNVVMTTIYSLRGPFAQFGRPSLVRAFAQEVAAATALNLEARLAGLSPPSRGKPLGLLRLTLRALYRLWRHR